MFSVVVLRTSETLSSSSSLKLIRNVNGKLFSFASNRSPESSNYRRLPLQTESIYTHFWDQIYHTALNAVSKYPMTELKRIASLAHLVSSDFPEYELSEIIQLRILRIYTLIIVWITPCHCFTSCLTRTEGESEGLLFLFIYFSAFVSLCLYVPNSMFLYFWLSTIHSVCRLSLSFWPLQDNLLGQDRTRYLINSKGQCRNINVRETATI